MRSLEFRPPRLNWKSTYLLLFLVLEISLLLLVSICFFDETRPLDRAVIFTIIINIAMAAGFVARWKQDQMEILVNEEILTFTPHFGKARIFDLRTLASATITSDRDRSFFLILKGGSEQLKIPFKPFAADDIKRLIARIRESLNVPLIVEDTTPEYADIIQLHPTDHCVAPALPTDSFTLGLSPIWCWGTVLGGLLCIGGLGYAIYIYFVEEKIMVSLMCGGVALFFLFVVVSLLMSRTVVDSQGVTVYTPFSRNALDYTEMTSIEINHIKAQHHTMTNIKILAADGVRKLEETLSIRPYEDCRRLARAIKTHCPNITIKIDPASPAKYRFLFDFMESFA